MKMVHPFRFALVVAAGSLLQSNILAGDKKGSEPEKKKVQPFKPIVINGELLNADLKDKLNQQSYCKTFTFKMEKGRTYQIELSSLAFPAALEYRRV